jgi:cobalt/nickel transport system permease protein
MHIPDAYLSPATEAVAFGVMMPFWTVAARKTVRQLSSRQVPLLSIGAAFCFAIQMFNIPAVGGTTAHALGATLLAILVGPWAALLGMTLELAIQALLFGDGGILSIGSNCFDMALVAPFVGFGLYRLLAGHQTAFSYRRIVAAGIGAYVGTVTAAFCAGVQLGIQPIIAHDAMGHALYCPYGLNISVPAMVMSHLLVAGPAEAIITVATLAYLWKTYPELVLTHSRPKIGTGLRLARVLGWVLVLTPIGLIADGSAFGEWELEELRKRIGYEPVGIAKSHPLIHPLFPDYGFAGFVGKPWEIVGYLASAFIGCCAVAVFTRSILRRPRIEPIDNPLPRSALGEMPRWLAGPNGPLNAAQTTKSPWIEKTLLRMRSAIAKTIAGEEVARARGLLQSINPLAKAIGFLSALIATGLASSPWTLAGLLGAVVFLARSSNVPLAGFLARVGAAVLFFGAVMAIPLSLEAVTPGPIAFQVFGVALSATGLRLAMTLLLRLGAGIGLALLWNLTTKWYQLLRSLHSLGTPHLFLTTATLTYRYLFVMIETLSEMVEARTARQVGAYSKRQARTYAGAGTAILFAKSLAFTEEMHLAMESRSYGAFPESAKQPALKLRDFALILAGLIPLAWVILHGRLHAF